MSFRTKAAWLLLVAIELFILTGCWNRRELNELSIASAFGFDKKKDQYQLTVQVINASEISANKSGGKRLPVITQQLAGGATIFESMRELTKTTPRKIYSSHIRIVVIGEKLAREGIAPVLDILSRDHELRTDFYFIIAKGTKAEDILKVLTPLEKIPSNKLYSSLNSAQNSWGVTSKIDLHELIFDLVSKGKDPALAAIKISGDPNIGESQKNLDSVHPPVTQEYDGMAVFHEDRLVGWLNPFESKGYNFIRGQIKSTIVTVGCPSGGKISIELLRENTKVKARVNDGKLNMEVKIQAEGNIGEVACGSEDIGNPETIKRLELAANKEIERMATASMTKAKQLKSDIFGFGNAVHRSHRHLWYPLEKEWDEYFVHLPVNIEAELSIRQTGSVVESFLRKMKGD